MIIKQPNSATSHSPQKQSTQQPIRTAQAEQESQQQAQAAQAAQTTQQQAQASQTAQTAQQQAQASQQPPTSPQQRTSSSPLPTNSSSPNSQVLKPSDKFLTITPIGRNHIFRFCRDKYTLVVPLRALQLFILLILVWLGVMVASLMIGSHHLTVGEVWNTLFGTAPNQVADTVVWQLRFPRAIAASFTGMMLALSGATLQNVTRNPLADPSLVGVSQGAGLAVVGLIVMFPEVSHYWRPFAAFGGAIFIAVIIQWIAFNKKGEQTMRFILTGIGVAALVSAIINGFLTYGNLDRAASALGWLAGSVNSVTWIEVEYVSLALLVIIPLTFMASRPMSVLRMGDELATTLGIRIVFARFGMVTLSVALAALAVAAVGPITFVGLVASHIARRLVHSGVGLHLGLTAMIGAILVSLADLLGRTLFAPLEIPAGLFTALIGVPIFVFLILRGNAKSTL